MSNSKRFLVQLGIGLLALVTGAGAATAAEFPYSMRADVLDLWQLPQSGYHDSILDYLNQGKLVRWESTRKNRGPKFSHIAVHDATTRKIVSEIKFAENMEVEAFPAGQSRIAVLVSHNDDEAMPPSLNIYAFPQLTLLSTIPLPHMELSHGVYLPRSQSFLLSGWNDFVRVDRLGRVKTKSFSVGAINFGFRVSKSNEAVLWTTRKEEANANEIHVWSLADWRETNTFETAESYDLNGVVIEDTNLVSMLSDDAAVHNCRIYDYKTGEEQAHLAYACNYTYIGETYVNFGTPEMIRSVDYGAQAERGKPYGLEIVDMSTGEVTRSFKYRDILTEGRYFHNGAYFLIVTRLGVYIYETTDWTLVYDDQFIASRWANVAFFDGENKLIISDIFSGRSAMIDIQRIISWHKQN